MSKKISIDNCHELASLHNGKFLSDVYIKTKTKYWWQCENNHVWETPYSYVQQGNWCPECAGVKKLTIKDIQERLLLKHKGIVTIDDCVIYENLHSEIKFTDKDYGDWYTKIYVVLSGHGHPKRGLKQISTKATHSASFVAKQIYDLFQGNVILLEDTYVGLKKKCKFFHTQYGHFFNTPNAVLNRTFRS